MSSKIQKYTGSKRSHETTWWLLQKGKIRFFDYKIFRCKNVRQNFISFFFGVILQKLVISKLVNWDVVNRVVVIVNNFPKYVIKA